MLRFKRTVLIFCGYCGIVQKTDKANDHCRNIHNDKFRALKPNEKPNEPAYLNWESFIKDFPNTEPIRDPDAITYRKADDLGLLLEAHPKKLLEETRNRGEKKAIKALHKAVEKGI